MMEGGVRSRTWRVIAAVVFLCSLVLSLTYFSFRGRFRSVKQDENISETVPMELKKGNVLFNGKELSFQTDFTVAESGLLASLTQSGHKELEGEAEWRLMNASLLCGHEEFRFKAVGPDAADLKLEMNNSDLLPLTQVPSACGFSVEQTALGLVLRVPFDGCSVKKENETYVLALRWRDNTVNLTCPVLASPEEMPDASQSLQQPDESASSEPRSRPKRQWKWPVMYSPCYPHRLLPLCWRTTPPPTTTTTTTTAAPTMPTILPPQLLSKLLDLYPIYEQYLQNHPHVKPYLNAYKHPGVHLFHKLTQSQQRHRHHHPFHHLLEKHFHFTTTEPPTTTVPTTTPCGKTTTTSGPGCPGPQRWFFPFRKHHFSPRVSFNENDPSFSMDGGYDTRDQATPDSFWESFPLMHSTDEEDPWFDVKD